MLAGEDAGGFAGAGFVGGPRARFIGGRWMAGAGFIGGGGFAVAGFTGGGGSTIARFTSGGGFSGADSVSWEGGESSPNSISVIFDSVYSRNLRKIHH